MDKYIPSEHLVELDDAQSQVIDSERSNPNRGWNPKGYCMVHCESLVERAWITGTLIGTHKECPSTKDIVWLGVLDGLFELKRETLGND
ncbi:hypothetical protein L1887_35687 [Cichorium endivia]|nr:hypothetical protein L1887_35687 [Cichorium endivia]